MIYPPNTSVNDPFVVAVSLSFLPFKWSFLLLFGLMYVHDVLNFLLPPFPWGPILFPHLPLLPPDLCSFVVVPSLHNYFPVYEFFGVIPVTVERYF